MCRGCVCGEKEACLLSPLGWAAFQDPSGDPLETEASSLFPLTLLASSGFHPRCYPSCVWPEGLAWGVGSGASGHEIPSRGMWSSRPTLRPQRAQWEQPGRLGRQILGRPVLPLWPAAPPPLCGGDARQLGGYTLLQPGGRGEQVPTGESAIV